ncbi:MAG: hypothetical protein ABIP41_04045 [Croceibacterium sp.]
MKRRLWLTAAALAVTSTLALAAPESLLPPSFDRPAPGPAPRPAATPAPPAGTSAVVQPLPSRGANPGDEAQLPVKLPGNLPSLGELEKMDPDQLDALFGLKPKFDVPPGARRAMQDVGVLSEAEGGFPEMSLANQPAALVRAILSGTKRPLLSRWGHILVRRALASRLDAPQGMDPVEFAGLRAALLNRLGEAATARALVQDVDSANYDAALAAAALDAYLATGDLLGACPVAQLKADLLKTPTWQMTKSICRAFAGSGRDADRELDRALFYGLAPRIDVLLAQRFAGAAGETRREINIEWQGVNELNPWRVSLARALGVDIPDPLRQAAPQYDFSDVAIPAVSLTDRVTAADRAGARGVLSSQAMVDLYSQLWADPSADDTDKTRAGTLRDAYAARDTADRVAALRTLWGTGGGDYGAQVLTAYAAARLPVSQDLAGDAPQIVASMLAAGLDRNALQWGRVVAEGSAAWGLLALAQPNRATTVSSGAVSKYIDQDASEAQRKSKFLVAGLAGLGRLDAGTTAGLAGDLKINLARESVWSRKIDRAAALNDGALVALLAGLGMQGEGWDKMTPRHLFHIVRSLTQVGLEAEARMIAAEAVARA